MRLDGIALPDERAAVDDDRIRRLWSVLSAADLTSIGFGMADVLCRRSIAHATSRVQFPGLFHDEESRDPIGIRGVFLAGQRELVRVLMARVIRGEAQGLSGEDDAAFLRIDDDRLMAGRMAGRGHDMDAGPRLGVSVDLLERGAGKIRDMRKMGVVVLLPGMRELALLHEDRGPREMAIAARMVGVEVTVGDQLHVGYAVAGGAQRFVDRAHVHRLVEIDHLPRLRREPGVEQEDPALMLDDERRDHNAFAGEPISVGGHRVMPGVDGLDTRMNHRVSD